VILSAGLGGSGAYWAPNLSALAQSHRLVVYDHRGTGRSSRCLPDKVSVEDLADDILMLMDELGLKRAHIIGHAAGGMAALALALKAPERVGGIVIANGWITPDPHFLRCFEARLNLLRHAGPEAFLRAQPIFLFPRHGFRSITASWTMSWTTRWPPFPDARRWKSASRRWPLSTSPTGSGRLLTPSSPMPHATTCWCPSPAPPRG
jgi:pimeloyl-ACP methyl ester carboxylesterase